jgi:hypothetical protein
VREVIDRILVAQGKAQLVLNYFLDQAGLPPAPAARARREPQRP